MKTLDGALSTPGVIPEGRYRMEEGFDIFSHIGGDKNEVRLKGRFVPEELRRIADHLDPQPDEGDYRRGYLQAIDDALREVDSVEDDAGPMTAWDALHKVEQRIVRLKARLTPA
jgi:hypothetical protein